LRSDHIDRVSDSGIDAHANSLYDTYADTHGGA
jgi:hypothetical protein